LNPVYIILFVANQDVKKKSCWNYSFCCYIWAYML